MAEFALGGDTGGHSWNNAIAHATHEENVEKFGAETARDYLRKEIRSFIQEQKGQESQWSLTLQDGRMITETGVSLDEMTANITQGRYASLVPENIKATAPLEAATLREATRLAVEGAEKIILPEQHLDGEGNIVTRYLSVWTKNAADPTRFDGSRIDLGKNIRIEDVRTGTSFTAFEQQESISFHQHAHQKQAFVLAIHANATDSFTGIKNAMVTKIHRSHQETYSRPLEPVPREPQQKQTMRQESRRAAMVTDIPSRVLRDSRETVRGVAVYLRNKKSQKAIHETGMVGRVHSIERGRERTPERLTIAKIREKPVRVIETINKRHSEMRVDARAIVLIAQIGTLTHAAPVLLARLGEPLPIPVRAFEKSIRRHGEKELRITNYELRNRKKRKNNAVLGKRESGEAKVEGKSPPDGEAGKKEKINVEHIAKTKEQSKRVKRGGEKWIKTVAAAEILAPIATEKRERRVRKRLRRIMRRAEHVLERKNLPKREKKLWVVLAVVARELASQGQLLSRSKKEERKVTKPGFKRAKPGFVENMQSLERESIVGVRFALAVWALLHHANLLSTGGKLATVSGDKIRLDPRLRGDDKKSDRKAVKIEMDRNESFTPWVLLSIIQYLTAIREQGMQTNQTNSTRPPSLRSGVSGQANTTNTTNQQIKIVQGILPQQAVIFAYAS